MNIRFLLLFLSGVSIIFISIFGVSAYRYYVALHADDPIDPVFFMEQGSGKIIRQDTAIILDEAEKYIIQTDDIIETASQSYGTITWPDKSITRLGEDTRIIVRKIQVSRNYENIEISYDMKRGKVWNTVIRLLLGDSYFEARLPRESIIAWVRGTTFEVNLTNGYIHAVEHATRLSDSSGKSLSLLPGELVSSENIWLAKWREWLDMSWQDWNNLKDTSYKWLRSLEIKKRLSSLLPGEDTLSFDTLVRAVLRKREDFIDIDIAQSLRMIDTEQLKQYNTSTLLSYYQKLWGWDDEASRDALRSAIIEKSDATPGETNIKKLLTEISLWESIETGELMPSLEKSVNQNTEKLRQYMQIIQINKSIESGKEDIRTNIRTLIGK